MYRVLAVDDNDLNLSLFRLFLTQLGHEVSAVNNPFDAIELARTEPFDIIFTDIQMPGMTGLEASTQLRQNGFRGPIIAITAHLSKDEETNILESGINGVLIKPVTKADLVKTLEASLEESRREESLEVRSGQAEYEVELPSQAIDAIDAVVPTAIFDVDLALARANGSSSLAIEMLDLLLTSFAEVRAVLNEQPDNETLSRTLHKFAGGVRFSGAACLEAELERTRQQLDDNVADTDSLLAHMQTLEDWREANPHPFG